jgi:hypothetical protein
MLLTTVIFQNAELSTEYLGWNLRSLWEWNREGLEQNQIIVVSQLRDSSKVRQICAEALFPIEVFECGNEFVGDYPVWDLFQSLRIIWPSILGEYVTIHHTEFLWMPGLLQRTIDYLKSNKPCLALGNLRRPFKAGCETKESVEAAAELIAPMTAGDWAAARAIAEAMLTKHWVFWRSEQAPGKSMWWEDVFFAARSWLEAWKMPYHGGDQPFQDVYDVVGKALSSMVRHHVDPPIVRMTMDVNKIVHVSHPRPFGYIDPKLQNYFMSDPKRWGLLALSKRELWWDMLRSKGQPDRDAHQNLDALLYRSLVRHRMGAYGTVGRYGKSFDKWLGNGGQQTLRSYYARRPGSKRVDPPIRKPADGRRIAARNRFGAFDRPVDRTGVHR